MEKKMYVGIDMGTSSVGLAVTRVFNTCKSKKISQAAEMRYFFVKFSSFLCCMCCMFVVYYSDGGVLYEIVF